jgi:hypothetical protein
MEIEDLKTLSAKKAKEALDSLYQNPHVTMIAGAQADYRTIATGRMVSDKLWNSIKEELRGAYAMDWWNESTNEAKWNLLGEHGIEEKDDQ